MSAPTSYRPFQTCHISAQTWGMKFFQLLHVIVSAFFLLLLGSTDWSFHAVSLSRALEHVFFLSTIWLCTFARVCLLFTRDCDLFRDWDGQYFWYDRSCPAIRTFRPNSVYHTSAFVVAERYCRAKSKACCVQILTYSPLCLNCVQVGKKRSSLLVNLW